MGLVTVPCIVLGHLTRAQRKACVIADNKPALGFSPEEFAALTGRMSLIRTTAPRLTAAHRRIGSSDL